MLMSTQVTAAEAGLVEVLIFSMPCLFPSHVLVRAPVGLQGGRQGIGQGA